MKGNTPLSKALYSCNHGYRLHGLKERQCQNNGIWYGDAPTCKSKYNCTFLLNYTLNTCMHAHKKGACCSCILHMHISFSMKVIWHSGDTEFNSVLLILSTQKSPVSKRCMLFCCILHMHNIISFSMKMTWHSGDTEFNFIHTEITCLNLKAPLYGKVDVKGYTPLSKALYSCNHGYRLHGLKERQCQNNGIWYGDAPTCKSKL